MYDGERRVDAARDVVVAGAEWIAEEQFVTTRVEKTAASRGDLASRRAAHDSGDRFYGLVHLRFSGPFHMSVILAEAREQIAGTFLLTAGPHKLRAAQL